MNALKIILFDGSFQTTSFINRLAAGLAARHEVYILGFNETLSQKIEGVHYVPLGSNQNNIRLAMTSFLYALQSGSVKKTSTTIKRLFKGEKRNLQEANLRFVLNKISPDLIHLQWPSVIPWFEDVLEKQEIPVVLSQRGYHSNVRPFVQPENFNYLQTWFPKIAGFHSVSKAIAANGDKIYTATNKIDHVVYTGLNLEAFPFSETYQRDTPLQILSVGRAHWKKGYDNALRACALLKVRGIAFQYRIIGAAAEEELQFLIADLNLEDCVFLDDRLSQEAVYQQMQKASLLLLPSVEEGLPNVVVEAMALGLPVLASNCGGVPEVIENGVEGWLFPTRDVEAMAGGVVAFAKLPMKTIEEVRLAARAKVEVQNCEMQMVVGMEGLYYGVLERL
ncbi:glycosyltransferase [Aequorivita marina]|uniref:glycosyltransferase n=1 Tax=Aequorivita marina TaxID=3073654 RepID=UPI002874784A|nr:glycosyltransferase [Aequorivita sp. S2608]MDS1298048.1 glycosyltransferase [Aequorivita sp. S2608]